MELEEMFLLHLVEQMWVKLALPLMQLCFEHNQVFWRCRNKEPHFSGFLCRVVLSGMKSSFLSLTFTGTKMRVELSLPLTQHSLRAQSISSDSN